jgi:acyl carrier protein
MSGLDDRLLACLRATFPEVPPEALRTASTETLEEWDSLHAVILMAVLEEEFGTRIPTRDYPALRSYDSIQTYLARR